jgi:hypothetical protein
MIHPKHFSNWREHETGFTTLEKQRQGKKP